MKQAKLALTAVAVLAVIGGALAFKANSAQTKFFYKVATEANCTAPTTLQYVVDPAGPSITNLSTTTVSGACPQIRVRFSA